MVEGGTGQEIQKPQGSQLSSNSGETGMKWRVQEEKAEAVREQKTWGLNCMWAVEMKMWA